MLSPTDSTWPAPREAEHHESRSQIEHVAAAVLLSGKFNKTEDFCIVFKNSKIQDEIRIDMFRGRDYFSRISGEFPPKISWYNWFGYLLWLTRI